MGEMEARWSKMSSGVILKLMDSPRESIYFSPFSLHSIFGSDPSRDLSNWRKHARKGGMSRGEWLQWKKGQKGGRRGGDLVEICAVSATGQPAALKNDIPLSTHHRVSLCVCSQIIIVQTHSSGEEGTITMGGVVGLIWQQLLGISGNSQIELA